MIAKLKKKIWILTLFPEYFDPLLRTSGVIARSLNANSAGDTASLKSIKSKLDISLDFHMVQIRDWANNRYGSVDDSPYGGGPGVIMRADVLKSALENGVLVPGGYQRQLSFASTKYRGLVIVHSSARGKLWSNNLAKEMANYLYSPSPDESAEQMETMEEAAIVKSCGGDLVFICSRYEGVDQRFIKHYVDQEFSVGDYILSGGEIAVMAILDSTLRYLPGMLGNDLSSQQESFAEDGLLEAPQYTRPRFFEGEEVPAVLLSGNHKEIANYHAQKSRELTRQSRADLWDRFTKTEITKTEIKNGN